MTKLKTWCAPTVNFAANKISVSPSFFRVCMLQRFYSDFFTRLKSESFGWFAWMIESMLRNSEKKSLCQPFFSFQFWSFFEVFSFEIAVNPRSSSNAINLIIELKCLGANFKQVLKRQDCLKHKGMIPRFTLPTRTALWFHVKWRFKEYKSKVFDITVQCVFVILGLWRRPLASQLFLLKQLFELVPRVWGRKAFCLQYYTSKYLPLNRTQSLSTLHLFCI